MVERGSDRPPPKAQVADVLRDRIRSGELADGTLLPAEHRMAYDFDVSVDVMRAALGILRSEGLIVTKAPYGSRVRRPERRTVRVQRGSQVTVRMPSPEERRTHGLPEGVPLLELTHPSGRVEVLPADEVTLTFA